MKTSDIAALQDAIAKWVLHVGHVLECGDFSPLSAIGQHRCEVSGSIEADSTCA